MITGVEVTAIPHAFVAVTVAVILSDPPPLNAEITPVVGLIVRVLPNVNGALGVMVYVKPELGLNDGPALTVSVLPSASLSIGGIGTPVNVGTGEHTGSGDSKPSSGIAKTCGI